MRVGTDCSGIEAPIQALMRTGIDFDHVFSSDIDKYIKMVSESIYKPEYFYDDLMTRDNSKAPQVDLYCAGFPCQAFSMAGKRKGFDDIRGSVFFGVADYIKQQQPAVFILENVKGLLSHEKGRTFQTILDVLAGNGTINQQISIPFYDDGLDYHIHHAVINTKNHGIPQNRERVFIVGFKDQREFSFPKAERLTKYVEDVLDHNAHDKYNLSVDAIKSLILNDQNLQPSNINPNIASALQAPGNSCGSYKGMNVITNTIKGYEVANIGDTIRLGNINSKTARARVIKGLAHTLQSGENQAVLLGPGLRKLTPLEYFRLQDFSDEFFDEVKAMNISDTQLYKMGANSITVRVLEKILNKIYQ